ncbi:MAG: DUF503 domain-containing protein [Deltaproteobacteria bacterium]|nr:MAG: DUF503 domain-containing protein [Deltaproteobacteria bacterium]
MTEMVVGICRITLSLPGNDSLKGKRKVVRRILDRARSRFNVAAAEVGDNDVHRRAVLGFTVVSNDSRHVNSMLDEVSAFVEGATEAIIVDRFFDIQHVGES